ncbi:MAG: CDC27 family protein, partial [Planctomycetota bacterium]|nr:CDC27 family protein [Planctomycetota bacterium]
MRTESLALNVCSLTLLFSALITGEQAKPSLRPTRAALQAGNFTGAVAAADAYLKTKPKDSDYALYLKALALFHGNKFNESAAECDKVVRENKSAWLRKARFLKAQTMLKQKKFREAEVIY